MKTNPESLESEIANQVQALRAPLATVRAAAARRLGQLKTEAEALVTALQDSHEIVRVSAAQALGNLPTDDESQNALILDHLLSAIDDASDKVCQAAIWALGMRRETSAADQIAEMLAVSNPFIAGNAVLALARIEDPRAALHVIEYLNHPNDYVKTQAVRAVTLLRYAPAGPGILNLFTHLKAEREQKGIPRHTLVNNLFEAIAALELREAVPLLLETAQQDVGLRTKAVETLIALQAEEAAAQLAPMLADPSANLRRNLLHLMGQFRYLPAVPLIRPLLHDNQPAVRKAAVQVLTRLDDRESAATIEWMCFHDSSPFTRIEAVVSLTHLLGVDALPALRALANDPNVDVRRAVVDGLLELDVWSEPDLRVAARFASDFPQDELSARLQGILANYPPLLPETGPVTPAPPDIPQAILTDREQLISLLQSWQAGLPAHSATEATRAALQHLLAILQSTEK
jgi:HEAT repeat protein